MLFFILFYFAILFLGIRFFIAMFSGALVHSIKLMIILVCFQVLSVILEVLKSYVAIHNIELC